MSLSSIISQSTIHSKHFASFCHANKHEPQNQAGIHSLHRRCVSAERALFGTTGYIIQTSREATWVSSAAPSNQNANKGSAGKRKITSWCPTTQPTFVHSSRRNSQLPDPSFTRCPLNRASFKRGIHKLNYCSPRLIASHKTLAMYLHSRTRQCESWNICRI